MNGMLDGIVNLIRETAQRDNLRSQSEKLVVRLASGVGDDVVHYYSGRGNG